MAELLSFLFGPLFSVFTGLVGLLWPPDSPETKQLQRWCGAAAVVTLLLFALAIRALLLGSLTLAVGALAGSMGLGWVTEWLQSEIEQRCLDTEYHKQQAEKQSLR